MRGHRAQKHGEETMTAQTRVLARSRARHLTEAEMEMVSGAGWKSGTVRTTYSQDGIPQGTDQDAGVEYDR